MPGKKQISKTLLELCMHLSNADAKLIQPMLLHAKADYDEEQINKLTQSCEWFLDTSNRAVLIRKSDAATVTKIKIGNDTLYARFSGSYAFFPEPGPLMRPAYIQEFVDEVKKEKNGWGDTGPNGLMYRGHNVFNIYISKEFNDEVTELIQNDEEIRTPECCDHECKRFFHDMRGKCDFSEEMEQAMEKCCAKHKVKPEDISCQEVFLGYDQSDDYFISAWDVWGSGNTGCVIIAFRIGEDGRFYGYHGRGCSDDMYRRIESFYDASDLKFYEKRKPGSRPGYGEGKSLYDLISGEGNPEFSIVSIRLD